MAGSMLEAAIVFLGAVAIGALVGRRWLALLPTVVALSWIGYAAVVSGPDRDGVPVWQIALMVGGGVAAALTLALAAGIVLGRWLRFRRTDRRCRALIH